MNEWIKDLKKNAVDLIHMWVLEDNWGFKNTVVPSCYSMDLKNSPKVHVIKTLFPA
jgi:hypothetical protein